MLITIAFAVATWRYSQYETKLVNLAGGKLAQRGMQLQMQMQMQMQTPRTAFVHHVQTV
jgi:hypothetical protein